MSIEELIALKGKDYGKPEYFFGSLAEMWTQMLGKQISTTDAVAMMVVFKALRAANNPDLRDSWIDIQGYGKIGEDL
jgi:hypothetical protein|tara:strand:- start:836 stop:1066 length:231 start_codon:yes stop_codon:yes gene_type:complete